jgi:hypothetical protein
VLLRLRRHSKDDKKMIDLRLGERLESGLIRPRSVKSTAHKEEHDKSDDSAVGLLSLLFLAPLAFLFTRAQLLFFFFRSCGSNSLRLCFYLDFAFDRRFRGGTRLRMGGCF